MSLIQGGRTYAQKDQDHSQRHFDHTQSCTDRDDRKPPGRGSMIG